MRDAPIAGYKKSAGIDDGRFGRLRCSGCKTRSLDW
jgi:hypothetical protein